MCICIHLKYTCFSSKKVGYCWEYMGITVAPPLVWSAWSGLWVPPVRPVWSKSTKYNLDRPRRVGQDSYVEHSYQSPDERDMPSGRSTRPASHTGLTGAPDWSDRCSWVRAKTRSPDRFRPVKGFSYGVRPSHPINIRGHDRLRFIIELIKYIYSLSFCFYFYLFSLALSTSICCSSFVSGTSEDVLGGLPTLEQPYVHQLWRGPSRADVRRSTAGLSGNPV
jgi:hypothetical protein